MTPMKTLSLKESTGQMVMPRLDGPRLSDAAYFSEAVRLVKEGIGGFILFGGDVKNTPGFLGELQSIAAIPLIIASDVERGLGQQLSGGTRFPSQRAVSSSVNRRSKKDVGLLHRMLDAVRIETCAAGIQAVFSPVVDVNNNPDNPIICTRAFGEDPETVEWFGSQYIRRLQKSSEGEGLDLLACAKHFPGHGDTNQDSHSVLPVIRADKARLNRVELPPFREAVRAGVGMVMIAHLLVPAFDPDKPVTFSKKTVTALLREGMEFGGLIVSDALDMGALAGDYSQEEIAVRAVEAGMDILLHPRDAMVTRDAVAGAVGNGRLTQSRIAESVERIMAAKRRLGLFDRTRQSAAAAIAVNYEMHRLIAREIAGRAIRVVSGNKKRLPLDKGKGASCFVLDDDGANMGDVFVKGLLAKFGNVNAMRLTPDSGVSGRHIEDSMSSAGAVVIAIFSKISASKGRSGISPGLRDTAFEILRAAKAGSKRTAVISFDSPYILDQFRDADIRIAAYDGMDAIQEAAADLLASGSKARAQKRSKTAP